MKRYLVFTLSFCFFHFSFAQHDVQLPGIVVEQNSQFNTGEVNYLSNTQIKAAGASPQLSDSRGKFTLVFADKPFGNVTRVYASKKDYEVVNEEEMKKAAVLGRNAPLKVVLCKQGQLYENQVTYYNIARDATLEAHKRRVAILEKEGKKREELIAQMRLEFNQEINSIQEAKQLLNKQLTSAQQQAQELADKFVTVNLDDQSATYQRAFRAFLEKNIDKALAILDSVDLKERLETNTAEKVKEENLIDTLQVSIAKRKEQIQQDVNQCVFKARLHVLKYEFNEADSMFALAIRYQPENLELAFEYAVFLHKQNQFDKAEMTYQNLLEKLRNHPEKDSTSYLIKITTTLNNLGVLFWKNNELEKAKNTLLEALEITKTLNKSESETYLVKLSQTLNNLGLSFKDNRELDQARYYFEEALKIERKLANKNPKDHLSKLAQILNNYADLFNKLGQLEESKTYNEEALKVRRTLVKHNPKANLYGLSESLNNLGILLDHFNQSEKAINYLEEALEIRRTLAKHNPDAYIHFVARTLNNLGNIYKKHSQIEKAKIAYEEVVEIRKSLTYQSSNPKYILELSNTLNNLGILSIQERNAKKATYLFKEALKTIQDIANDDSNLDSTYLAEILTHLGIAYIENGELKEAEKILLQALTIRERLSDKNPIEYNLDVIMTSVNLGICYRKILIKENNIRVKELGIKLMDKAKRKLSIFDTGHPKVNKYEKDIKYLSDFFSSFSEEQYLLKKKMNRLDTLSKYLETTSNFHDKVSIQEEIINTSLKIAESFPNNAKIQNAISHEYGLLAWYLLFDRQFVEAEVAARKGLEIDPSTNRLNLDLVLSLLYQSNWKEAKSIYLRLKDQPYMKETYRAAFLRDLDALEKEGITHPDVAKARALLKE